MTRPAQESRFQDHLDGTVIDRLTGLIWMQNANCWDTLTWEEALANVRDLNVGSIKCKGYFSGTHRDWRLPNKAELISLIDYGRFNPVLPDGHPFTGVQSISVYWSSTTQAGHPAKAWFMFLNFGHLYTQVKTSRYFVWPVRGGRSVSDPWTEGSGHSVARTGQRVSYQHGDDGALQTGHLWPMPRFVDQGDGTMRDAMTGLVWMRHADCWPGLNWRTALRRIEDLNGGLATCAGYLQGTHTDWRVPGLNELQSLLDADRFDPALPAGHPFQGVQTQGVYWSGTPMADRAFDEAWTIDLQNGYVRTHDKNQDHHLWPVRTGP